MRTKQQRERDAVEREAWRNVLQHLRDAGAVTEADLAAPLGSDDTQGQMLINAIRRWGSEVGEQYHQRAYDGFARDYKDARDAGDYTSLDEEMSR